VTLRLFAGVREIVGAADLVREADEGATVRDVWTALAREFPRLEPYAPIISVARNLEYARFDTPVADDDEVAFLPPVSGG
jgi:molybdopterin converting factor small subunit